MQTNKEALLALLKGEKADFIPEVYSTMKDVVFPVSYTHLTLPTKA